MQQPRDGAHGKKTVSRRMHEQYTALSGRRCWWNLVHPMPAEPARPLPCSRNGDAAGRRSIHLHHQQTDLLKETA